MVSRIETIKQYLAEAEQSPEGNELYIEDLKLSLTLFKNVPEQTTEFEVKSGFTIDS